MTNKELLEDLLIEFDELDMQPMIIVPDPLDRAERWKHELTYAINHLKAEVAREIIDDLASEGLLNVEPWGIANIKKKYTEGGNVAYGGPREGGKRFAEKQFLLYRLKREVHDKAVRPHNAGIDAYISLKVFDAILQGYLNKL